MASNIWKERLLSKQNKGRRVGKAIMIQNGGFVEIEYM